MCKLQKDVGLGTQSLLHLKMFIISEAHQLRTQKIYSSVVLGTPQNPCLLSREYILSLRRKEGDGMNNIEVNVFSS